MYCPPIAIVSSYIATGILASYIAKYICMVMMEKQASMHANCIQLAITLYYIVIVI